MAKRLKTCMRSSLRLKTYAKRDVKVEKSAKKIVGIKEVLNEKKHRKKAEARGRVSNASERTMTNG